MVAAFGRALPHALLGLLPLLLLGFAADLALSRHELGIDFRQELYPEARLVLHRADPFPSPGVALTGADLIWPVPAALLAAPFTVLPAGAATALWCLASLLMLPLALWLLDAWHPG